MKTNTLTLDLPRKTGACRRAANYVSAGQMYLCDNPCSGGRSS